MYIRLIGVYVGVVAGGHSAHTGGGNQYLCMTESPEWGPSIAANGYSWLYGAEYMANDAMFTKTNAPTVINHDANCAVCRSQRQSQVGLLISCTLKSVHEQLM